MGTVRHIFEAFLVFKVFCFCLITPTLSLLTKPTKTSSANGFELEYSLKATNDIPVRKYKSSRTGLTVVISEVKGPQVTGYFVLATEAHDDDGLPHTLEHLIFLGSEDYPYKGVLDLLANRCLAQGTNAWTATDHTAYTMKTAGSEGFLSIMPIYLDHILYPTLTDSAFVTEVHHVTKDGTDAGVVYSEMEGRENSDSSRSYYTLLQQLYPDRCGYKSETGGILKNLRESTTNQKVKDYHKKFYRPENLSLIINGQIKPEEVLNVLAKFEEKIIKKGAREPFSKPWQTACPQLTKSVETEVRFPSDTEDSGLVEIGWRGPSVVKEYETLVQLNVILTYLTSSSVSPLEKNLVQIQDPFASSVSYNTAESADSVIELTLENVPVSKMDEVKHKVNSILNNIVTGTEAIDMERIKNIINRRQMVELQNFDSDPHETLANRIIANVLYGATKQDLELRLNEVSILDKIKKYDANFWKDLIKKNLIDQPSVVVKATPSKAEQKRLQNEELARVAKRKNHLGSDGLAKNGKQLEDAIAANNRAPPNEILTSIPVPDLKKIPYLSIQRYTSDSPQQHPKFDTKKSPVFTQVDDIKSNLIYINVIMDTSVLNNKERMYLPLLSILINQSPIKRDGKVIPFEQIISQQEINLVSIGTQYGFDQSSVYDCGSFCETGFLSIQVEPEKFEVGINMLREMMYQTVFTEERLKVATNSMLSSISSGKRDPGLIKNILMFEMLFKEGSNQYAFSILRQNKFLKNLSVSLGKPAVAKTIIQELTEVLKKITNPNKIVIHIGGDLEKLALRVKNPANKLSQLLPPGVKSTKNKVNVIPNHELITANNNSQDLSCVLGIGSAKSAYFNQAVPAIADYSSKDLAALLVFAEYLTQIEGPMWKRIRGPGYTYNIGMTVSVDEDLLILIFNRATDIVSSFREANTILKESVAANNKLDQILLDSAKSSLIYGFVATEMSVLGVTSQSQRFYFQKVAGDYNKKMTDEISKINLDDLKRIAEKYINRLVDLSKSKISIVADPAKIDSIAQAFNGFGKKLQVFKTIEESFLNK